MLHSVPTLSLLNNVVGSLSIGFNLIAELVSNHCHCLGGRKLTAAAYQLQSVLLTTKDMLASGNITKGNYQIMVQ